MSGTSPVLIASVGTLSGPVGAAFLPNVQALTAWVRWINDRGGLNGHSVKLFTYDDGADPARHRAQVQEAVEHRKVVAFVSNPEGLTGQQSVDYITSKRVPVIGGMGAETWFYKSPMYFPEGSYIPYLSQAVPYAAARIAVPAGKTKAGIMVCVEGDQCPLSEKIWKQEAKSAGFDVVYQSKISVAQPDFTAECIAGRNAGVQVFVVAIDPNSFQRLAASCNRQGFRPTFASLIAGLAHRQANDSNLEQMVGASINFPWFQTGTPATDEFHRALQTYGGAITLGPPVAQGWTVAKLFEKAGARMPEPPTSEAVLKGLWSIRSETLGGLVAHPLTFTENQLAERRTCWFTVATRAGSWVTPPNQPECLPAEKSQSMAP